MKTPTSVLNTCFIVLAVFVSAAVFADSAATGGEGPKTRVFEGQYKWINMDKPGPLRAEFTATGESHWDVDFHFWFDGRDRTYSGTAEGSLSEGVIKGKVRNENNRRTFTFEAALRNGRLEGTHRETTPSRARRTGTLRLSEQVSGS